MGITLTNPELREDSGSNFLSLYNAESGPLKALFSLHAPGPYASFSPVLGQLISRGVPVACISSAATNNNITNRLETDFPGGQTIPFEFRVNFTPEIFVATFDPREQRLLSILEKIHGNNTRLIFAEDYPGDCRKVIEDMLKKGIIPEKILVPMTDQQAIYETLHPGISVVTIGNPAFDDIAPWNETDAVKTRKILGLHPDTFVVTYIGLPTQDFPKTGHGLEVLGLSAWDSLESFTLQQLILQMMVMAIKFPDDHFTLVYKPHPRDDSDLTPIVKVALPANLHLVGTKEFWKNHQIKASEIAQVSHLVFAVMSTVLDEIAIRNSQSDSVLPLLASLIPRGTGFQPSRMNPDENSVFHRINFQELPIVTNQASILVSTVDHLELLINEVFLGNEGLYDIRNRQKIFAGKYLFPNPNATNRVISIIDQYLENPAAGSS